jgi:hypothetical protein
MTPLWVVSATMTHFPPLVNLFPHKTTSGRHLGALKVVRRPLTVNR